ncbi:MAG: amino acid carrier protein [Planctomycetota bacterium]
MVSLRRLAPVLATLLLAASAFAQGPGDDAKRRQPTAPGWQDQVNDVFGDLLSVFGYVPFYDIAGLLGIDTAPHRLVDEQGAPAPAHLQLPSLPGVEFAAFTPTGRRVLAADGQHRVHVLSLFRARWRQELAAGVDPATVPATTLCVLDGHGDAVTSAASFPDPASRVAMTDDFYRRTEITTGSRDGTARIWRLCSEAEQNNAEVPAPTETAQRTARQVLQHGAPVTAVAYSETGLWLATGGADGSAVVWDARCEKLATVRVDGPVTALAFEGDDALGVTAGGATQWFTAATGAAAEAPAQDAAADAPAGHLARTVTATGIELHDGTTVPIAGAGRGAIAADDTRALTWSQGGELAVHEWLVRGPTDQLAVVSVPIVVLWLVIAAVLFTLFFRFVNFRMFKHAILCVAGKFSNPADQGEVTHFQALSAALSATVGLGNIAGVAIAVMIGGPGATFWMVVAGLLGMTLKFTECTLGQKFRHIGPDGTVSGGPMHYLKEGLKQRSPALAPLGSLLAVVFTLFCIGGSIAGGNAFQVNQSLGVLRGQVPFFDHNPWVYGVVMAFFVGIVIIGGIKSIARVADKVVPTMCSIYVLSAAVVILLHLGDVPAAIGRIVSSALSGDAVYGGAIGALIMGFRRAAFSNEAGVGSASIAHSAARTPYPVREGIVALLEPFIDTVVVCTMTALVIGITGVYNAPEHAEIIATTNGAALTTEAFKSVGAFRDWFPWLLMVAVALFAYSTMISWSYYGERCAVNMFGPKASLPFKLLFLVFTVLGSIVTATNVLEFGDLMILLMAFPNIIGLYFLGGVVQRELGDYEQKLANGEITRFH